VCVCVLAIVLLFCCLVHRAWCLRPGTRPAQQCLQSGGCHGLAPSARRCDGCLRFQSQTRRFRARKMWEVRYSQCTWVCASPTALCLGSPWDVDVVVRGLRLTALTSGATRKEANRRLAIYAAAGVVMVVGASYAFVPLYQMFCKVCVQSPGQLHRSIWWLCCRMDSTPDVCSVVIRRQQVTVVHYKQSVMDGKRRSPSRGRRQSRCTFPGTPSAKCLGSFTRCSAR
jgi:hypothetical protein